MKPKFLILTTLLFSSLLNAQDTKGFLSQDEIALFHKQGYVLKKQCLSQSEINALNEEIDSVINRSLTLINSSPDLIVSDKDQMLYSHGSRIVCKKPTANPASIARINGCCGMEPGLLSLIRSEQMLHTFFELLGTTDLEHLIAQIHPKLPGDGVKYPRHRDIQFRKSFDPQWQDILGNGSYAICIIPVDRMSPENGGLWIDQNNYPDDQGLPENRLWINAEPGDLLFMHPYLYHGSGPNDSPVASRKTLLTGFCAFGANHKPYPGACVNTRLKLNAAGAIEITNAPWSEEVMAGPGAGH